MKGVLPVPRDVFARKGGRDTASEEALAKLTKDAEKQAEAEPGSREAWKAKMAEQRKRNLREGVRELKSRQQKTKRRMESSQATKYHEQAELLARPEREDERLTTPSNGLDLDALYHGAVPDPTRNARLALKRERHAAFAANKAADRLDSVHTLYSHARSYIVSTQALDKAVEDAFGTDDKPVTFGDDNKFGTDRSIWSDGKPESVQEMLNKANRASSTKPMQNTGGYLGLNQERIRRIGEALTGGKMDKSDSESYT